MESQKTQLYEFGAFRLDAGEGLLLRDGKPISLTPKVFETLLFLVRHAGHMLTKEELMTALWPDTFVEEGNLKVNVSALRKILGDTTDEPAFIETIPRRGYRFVAPVRVIENGRGLLPPAPAQITVERRVERTVTEEEIEEAEEDLVPATALTAGALVAGRARRWWAVAGIAVIPLALLIFLAIRASRPLKPSGTVAIVRVTYMGGRLQAWDEQNQLAWSHQFPEPVEAPRTTGHNLVFVDLDGSGARQMIVVLALQQAGGAYAPVNTIVCFSPRGELLWSYQPQMNLSFGGREYQGPWVVRDVLGSSDPNNRGVWAAFSHHTWWPSFLVRISGQGLADTRFVNSGHINMLSSVTTAHGSFILAGALNNEYNGAAALAILREDKPMVASPQSPGTQFWCDRCPEDRPFRYFVFPRSELNRLEGQGFNPFRSIVSNGDQLRLFTTELPGSNTFSYDGVYALNSRLELAESGYSEAYWTRHDQLHREGRLDHSAADCPERRHIAVRMWDRETGWREPATEAATAN